MEAIAITVVAGLVLVIITGGASRILDWTRERLGRPPLSAQLHPDIICAPSFGIFGVIQSNTLARVGSRGDLWKAIEEQRITYLSGTPLTMRLRNTSTPQDPRNALIKEISLTLRSYEHHVIEDSHLVNGTLIQAGGRGSEGEFVVKLCTQDLINVPILASASAETPETVHRLEIGPDHRAEVRIQICPAVPGRYSFDLSVLVEWRGRNREISVARGLNVLSTTSWSWVNNRVDSFGWSEVVSSQNCPRQGEAQYYAWLSELGPPCPDGRKVVVRGALSPEAWE